MNPDYQQVAAQLRKPTGADGLKTAARMADNNSYMITKSIDQLSLVGNERVMELGPGGGTHLPYLMRQADNIDYSGIDISETMITLCCSQNEALIATGNVSFTLVDSVNGYVTFPTPQDDFDKVFTVNTLYFWDNPLEQAREILRVLKPDGVLILCFADESFMRMMPFTQYGFHLYTVEEAKKLLETAGFSVCSVRSEIEEIIGINGERFDREIHFIKAFKMKPIRAAN